MARVKFGDVVNEIKINIDRKNNPYKYFVAGDHMESENLNISRRGRFENSDVGPAFIRLFKPGQVLYGSRRTYLKKVAVADFEGITSNTTFVLESKDDSKLLQKLLPFIILSDKFTDFSIKNSKGSTNPYILFSDLAKFEFNLPPIEEQKKLSNTLWAANETKQAYQKLFLVTNRLVAAKFVEAFGPLGQNVKGWGFTTLGKCCDINPSKSGDSRLKDGLNVSFVPMHAVTEKGSIDISVTKLYDDVKTGYTYFAEHDVLFAKITPCMENGKGAVASNLSNGIGFGSTEFFVLRPLEGISNPYWIYHLTMLPEFRNNAKKVMTGTGGQLRVPVSYLNDFPISLPPIELQNQYEEFVKLANRSQKELSNAITHIDTTIKCLIQKYLG